MNLGAPFSFMMPAPPGGGGGRRVRTPVWERQAPSPPPAPEARAPESEAPAPPAPPPESEPVRVRKPPERYAPYPGSERAGRIPREMRDAVEGWMRQTGRGAVNTIPSRQVLEFLDVYLPKLEDMRRVRAEIEGMSVRTDAEKNAKARKLSIMDRTMRLIESVRDRYEMFRRITGRDPLGEMQSRRAEEQRRVQEQEAERARQERESISAERKAQIESIDERISSLEDQMDEALRMEQNAGLAGDPTTQQFWRDREAELGRSIEELKRQRAEIEQSIPREEGRPEGAPSPAPAEGRKPAEAPKPEEGRTEKPAPPPPPTPQGTVQRRPGVIRRGWNWLTGGPRGIVAGGLVGMIIGSLRRRGDGVAAVPNVPVPPAGGAGEFPAPSAPPPTSASQPSEVRPSPGQAGQSIPPGSFDETIQRLHDAVSQALSGGQVDESRITDRERRTIGMIDNSIADTLEFMNRAREDYEGRMASLDGMIESIEGLMREYRDFDPARYYTQMDRAFREAFGGPPTIIATAMEVRKALGPQASHMPPALVDWIHDASVANWTQFVADRAFWERNREQFMDFVMSNSPAQILPRLIEASERIVESTQQGAAAMMRAYLDAAGTVGNLARSEADMSGLFEDIRRNSDVLSRLGRYTDIIGHLVGSWVALKAHDLEERRASEADEARRQEMDIERSRLIIQAMSVFGQLAQSSGGRGSEPDATNRVIAGAVMGVSPLFTINFSGFLDSWFNAMDAAHAGASEAYRRAFAPNEESIRRAQETARDSYARGGFPASAAGSIQAAAIAGTSIRNATGRAISSLLEPMLIAYAGRDGEEAARRLIAALRNDDSVERMALMQILESNLTDFYQAISRLQTPDPAEESMRSQALTFLLQVINGLRHGGAAGGM